jgi:hypothetical protein
MTVETLNQIFKWSAVILPFVLAFVGFGALITGNIINTRKDVIIQALQPRGISETQTKELLRHLENTHGKIGFVSRVLDGESADYADKLSAIFDKAHWEIAPPVRNSTNDLPGYVTLTGTNPNLAPLGKIVADALNAAHLDCRPQRIEPNTISGELQPDTIYVVIGRKG